MPTGLILEGKFRDDLLALLRRLLEWSLSFTENRSWNRQDRPVFPEKENFLGN